MKPLQAIAMGLVVLALGPTEPAFDPLPDPLGWLLVLVGLRGLPPSTELRPTLWTLGALATVVSVPLWFPAVLEALEDGEEAVAWAANLPELVFFTVLSLALARAATEAGDRTAAAWWSTLVLVWGAVAALPVLVFGGGLDGLSAVAGALVVAAPVLSIVLLFVHAGRGWAGAPASDGAPPAG
jgi:hypothetical protein